MKFKGTVKVTLFASCGWKDNTSVKFKVDCEPDPDTIQLQVELDHVGMAERWHFQDHGDCPGICHEAFHWN